MSDVHPQDRLADKISDHLAGRWQIPLLVLAFGLLAVGVWRVHPGPKPPSFDELYNQGVTLKNAELYAEASEYTRQLLIDPKRTEAERGRLHLLMCEVIFAHEQQNAIHGKDNSEAIIAHSNEALSPGESHKAETHRMRAMAFEWLDRPSKAVTEYRLAVDKGIDNPWGIEKNIINIERAVGTIGPDQLHKRYDAFLSAAGVPGDLQYWAAEKKIELLGEQGDYDSADKFLATHQDKFEGGQWAKAYEYLRALAWYHTGRVEEAESLLRRLRDQLVPGDSLYARTGWLLGKVLQDQGQPASALAFYDDVLKNSLPGQHKTAAMLGRAETLVELERFDESVDAYEKTIRLITEARYGSLIDLRDIRKSTRLWYQILKTSGKLPEAMAYLRLAARLAPPVDAPLQITYSKSLADLAMDLGNFYLARADAASAPKVHPDRKEAHRCLIEAGEEYLRLAKLTTLDIAASTGASWDAAELFDQAGERPRQIEVLEAFVRERPQSPRVPEALEKLGQGYQASGKFSEAIAKYQQNLTDHASTPAAVRCLVPLTECFIATDQMDKAETTLLRIVDRGPTESLSPIEPSAPEYKDALFKLAGLYTETTEYEKAIARYEESIERYSDDSRANEATYLLADAYRKSAAEIRVAIDDKKNIAYKDDLTLKYQSRLQRAHELFNNVIERYRDKLEASLSDLDRLYVKMSHFYQADTIYDLAFVTGGADQGPFSRAAAMYDRAAWIYQKDPIAMSAYTQMINCYLRMGNIDQARKTINRARWALGNISDEEFLKYAPNEGREYWNDYLTWLAKSPTIDRAQVANRPGGEVSG